MKKMFGFRKSAMVWTDKRARLIQELLGGMKVIKFFGKFANLALSSSIIFDADRNSLDE